MNTPKTIKIYTDGGARGNPGPAASGVYIIDESGTELYTLGHRLGITTNNVAEYTGVVLALSWVLIQNFSPSTLSHIQFFLDSELVVSQINGIYRVKNEALKTLLTQIRVKEAQITVPIRYTHIPREQNKQADRLVNMALDNKI